MGKNRFQTWLMGLWQPLAAYGVAIIATLGLLLFKLGSLVDGLAPSEWKEIQSNTLADIRSNPLYAPYKVVQLVFLDLFGNGPFVARLTAVLGGLLAVCLFFYIVRYWFSWRVAAITTLLFATSPWLLHSIRFSHASASYIAILAVIALGTKLKSRQASPYAVILSVLTIIGLLYIPAMFWLLIPGLVWQRRTIIKLYRQAPLFSTLCLLMLLIALAPLIYVLANNSTLLRSYIGLPLLPLQEIIKTIPNNLYTVFINVVWRGPSDPALWLGGMPLLNFFALILALLGLYNFSMDLKLDRSRFVIAGGLVCWGLVGLGGPVTNIILLPFCYLLVASGIAFMLKQWFTVFPLNPFARGLAIGLLIAGVTSVCWYNVNHYFIAWPQTPATLRTFSVQEPVVQ